MSLPKKLLPVLMVFAAVGILYLFLEEKVSAVWFVDITPPTCSITYDPPSPQPTDTNIQITAVATDNNNINSFLVTGVDFLSTVITTTTSTATSITRTFDNWIPTAGDYTLTLNASDNSGNTCSFSATFVVNQSVRAWIQVTGDVHSNGVINAGGGP